MAHLILTIDHSPAIRLAFMQEAISILSQDSALQIDSAESGDLAVVWAYGAQAPVDFSRNEGGCCLLLGYALDQEEKKLTADLLLGEWTEHARYQRAWDGYFAAVRYSEMHGLAIDVDLLGLFPLYLSESNGCFIAGSSATLFEAHPKFRTELDPVGLAGILLSNGLVNERTLIAGVRQLRLNCRLYRSPDGLVSEIEQAVFDSFVESEDSFDTTLSVVNHEFETTIKRHQPASGPHTLLLSGGLDSRHVGGYLDRLGIGFRAVTLGRSTDYEVRAAYQVAQSLQCEIELQSTEYSAEALLQTARQVASMEHLTHGFSGFQDPYSNFEAITPMFWSGYLLDDILGGSPVNYAWDQAAERPTFDGYFRRLNGWGLQPQRIAKLLRPVLSEGEQVVADLVESLRQTWDHYEGSETQKALRMKLATRARYHLAGILHRMSFISWPIAPFCDRRLLNCILSLPLASLVHRRLQHKLLQTEFPALATVPFDTNTFQFNTIPKLASTAGQRTWVQRAEQSLRSWYWLKWRKVEPRRYHRQYDPDQPDWRIIRRAVEPHRHEISDWLDEQELDRLVPPPDSNMQLKNPFALGVAMRTVCGLLLWKTSKSAQMKRAA